MEASAQKVSSSLQKKQDIYLLNSEEIFNEYGSSPTGLTAEQAKDRLSSQGPNTITHKSQISALSIYLEQFKNTLTLILLGSVFVILFIYFFGGRDQSDLIEAGLIFAIIVMITFLGFIQEYKAEKAIDSLKKMLAFRAKVKRDNRLIEIDIAELVTGDYVVLEEGLKVPADIRLIESFNLSTIESSLTGESAPVSKNASPLTAKSQIHDQKNMVFCGTVIASGRGWGVVVATGDKTEIGKIAKDVATGVEEQTPIQKRLNGIGKILSFIILGICAVVFVFIVFLAEDVSQLQLFQRIIHSFIASVSLAVAAIPEGLPAVVTISLALGTQRMLRKKALVRKLNSVETLGSTDVICSDKTGTLTKGEMTVTEIYTDSIRYTVTGTGYTSVGQIMQDGKKANLKDLELILKCGLVCNNATIKEDDTITGDPTEAALLVSAKKGHLSTQLTTVSEIPFSSERKMMSVLVNEDSGYIIYSKGATETLLNKCKYLTLDKKTKFLDTKQKDQILAQTQEMAANALRTLGFAYKHITKIEYEKNKDNLELLEKDLTFIGLQGMIDPPRAEVKELISKCQNSGIRVIMITGDHEETAKAVATEIGIQGHSITGAELDELSEEEFADMVEKISVYARVNPNAKMRIVDALKKHGHIVAMTGDGVNDAPALKRADIGIAMGITGTDVAKETSDMVLLDDHFGTIVAAIEEGRGIFHNIRKFVVYLLSCNIAEVIVVFLGVVVFQKLPLTATMLLWINVVTDGIPAVALGLDKAEKGIMKYKPQAFQSQIVTKRLWLEMVIFGFLLAIAVLGIYLFDLREGVEQAQGAAFTALVFFEIVILLIIRSNYNTPLLSNLWLIAAVFFTLALQTIIIYIPFVAKLFEIDHINIFDWMYILIVSIVLWFSFKGIQLLLDKFNILPENTVKSIY